MIFETFNIQICQ